MRRTLLLLLIVLVTALSAAGQQRPQNQSPHTVVVPAGTKITVDFPYTQHQAPQMYDAKVAWPVRIGFTTAIPAGAKVKVRVSIRNYDAGAVEVAELKSVTIGDHTYDLRTDSIESPPSAATEVTFTTISELRINR